MGMLLETLIILFPAFLQPTTPLPPESPSPFLNVSSIREGTSIFCVY